MEIYDFFFPTSDCFSNTVISGLGNSLQQKHKIAQIAGLHMHAL